MGGRSLLEWNLRWLVAAGIGPIWINLHYRAEEVRRAVEALGWPDTEIRFSHEDPILGTGGAWRALAAEWDDTSLVVYGDNMTRFDLRAFATAHRTAASLATLALFDPLRHANTGIAGSRAIVGGDGRVEGFEEIRGGLAGRSLVSTGACLLEPAVIQHVGPGFSDFGADVFPVLVRAGYLAAHVIEDDGFCLGLDTPMHFELGRDMVEGGRVRLG